MTRVGIFGGSFDPPHVGHLVVAEQARVREALDRVLWIPAAVSPLKRGGATADAHHRLTMVSLAIQANPGFDVSDIELARAGPSFTIDTLREIGSAHPDWDLHLIMGGDSLADFSRWKDPAGIRERAGVIVYPRDPSGQDLALAGQYGARVLDVPVVPVSSTGLRALHGEGGSIRYLVPESVFRYVNDHGLYR